MSIQTGSVQRIGTPTRRGVLKATMGVTIAMLWRGSPAYADEERMTDTTKSYALPSVLTYDDVRAVSPAKGPLPVKHGPRIRPWLSFPMPRWVR
jgi:hypothetical protein